MMRTLAAPVRALIPLGLVAAALITAHPATAEDLATLKARAQAIADEVTDLEHRLGTLDAKRGRLDDMIERADHEIGTLELEIDAAEDDYRAAVDAYVDRAVAAYKSGGSGSQLAVMLSARNINEFATLAEASANAAEMDADALERSLAARDSAATLQDRLADRKSRLLGARAAADAVGADIERTVDDRNSTLASLNAEIDKIQAEIVRRATSSSAGSAGPADVPAPSIKTSASLLERLRGTGPANGVPKGFTSTGVAFEGLASWYGPGFEGNPTATGDIYDSSLYTVASKTLPLNSYLYITRGDRSIVALVNDRGPYVEPRILDLSKGSAGALDMISAGVGWVRAEIIVRT